MGHLLVGSERSLVGISETADITLEVFPLEMDPGHVALQVRVLLEAFATQLTVVLEHAAVLDLKVTPDSLIGPVLLVAQSTRVDRTVVL